MKEIYRMNKISEKMITNKSKKGIKEWKNDDFSTKLNMKYETWARVRNDNRADSHIVFILRYLILDFFFIVGQFRNAPIAFCHTNVNLKPNGQELNF